MCGRLVLFYQIVRNAAAIGHHCAHSFGRAGENRLNGADSRSGQGEQIVKEDRCLHIQLSVMCHLSSSFLY